MTPPRPFGTLPDGRPVHEYTLTNAHGLKLCVTPYGAIVTQLHVPDRHGHFADVVCGFDNLDQYLDGHPYFGCIAGRVAGRITRGAFTLDGVDYQLAVNDPPNHLHGGRVGFDKKFWNLLELTTDTIRLSLISRDGDERYPGTVHVGVTYRLTNDNEFIVEYEATCDEATPLSLTHHGYFNLAGEGSGTIANHVLRINADTYAPADEMMTLVGRREPVTAANDFRKFRQLGDALDNLWKRHGDLYFDKYFDPAAASPGVPIAILSDLDSGRMMTVATTEPCVQLYTGVSLDGSLIGKSGRPYEPFGAVCLEAERYPDGVNNPSFGDIILRPGRVYRQTTIHTFANAIDESQ